MSFMKFLLSEPGLQQLQLAWVLIFTLLLFHLPYMGMVIVSSALSLGHRANKKMAMAEHFGKLVLGGIGTRFLFGLLPLIALLLLLPMVFYSSPLPMDLYMLQILGAVFVGMLFIYLGQKIEKLWPLGGLGVLITVLAYTGFFNTFALLIYPDRWPFMGEHLPHPFTITPVIHFTGFLLASLLITGVAVLFFYFHWKERKLADDVPEATELKYWGLGLALGGALLLPPALLWDFYTLPNQSLSLPVFILGANCLFALYILLMLTYVMLKGKHLRFTVIAFVLAIAVFGFLIGKDLQLQNTANQELVFLSQQKAQTNADEWAANREAEFRKKFKGAAVSGQAIFDKRCSACHLFDKVKLGPAYNDVVPKYKDNLDGLKAYLRNPVKVDPKFPAMPNPGLREYEVEAISTYLFKTVLKIEDKGAETPREGDAPGAEPEGAEPKATSPEPGADAPANPETNNNKEKK